MATSIMKRLQYGIYAVVVILGSSILHYSSVSGQCSCYSYHGKIITCSWNTARDECKKQSGDLVSLETLEEWEFIKNQIQTRQTMSTAHNEWWIGLKYEDSSKQWVWLTNTSLVYNKWQPGKPSDERLGNRYTLVAKQWPKDDHKGSFNSVQEALSRGYICEYKKSKGISACTQNMEWCSPISTTQRSITTIGVLTSTLSPTTATTSPTQDTEGHFIDISVQPTARSKPFPLYVIVIILAVLLVIVIVLVVFIIKFKNRREPKPRNSHLSRDARVPVRLERNSSCDNLNDKIIYADVINMDGHKIQINCGANDAIEAKNKPHVYAAIEKKQTKNGEMMELTNVDMNGVVNPYNVDNVVYAQVDKKTKKRENQQTNNNDEMARLLNKNVDDNELQPSSVTNPMYAEVEKRKKIKKKDQNLTENKILDSSANGKLKSDLSRSDEVLLVNDVDDASIGQADKNLYATIDDPTNGKACVNQEPGILYAQLADLDNADLTPPTKQSPYTETDYATIVTSHK